MPNRSLHVCGIAMIAMFAFAFLVPVLAWADETAKPKAEITDETFDAALAKAAAAKVGETEFRDALRSVASRFPLVEASTVTGNGEWQKLTLNARGKRVDAIRIRVPEGEPRDFVWAFAMPKGVDRWYILAVDGEMKQGFRNFWKAKPAELFGPDASKLPATSSELGVVQMLDAKQLKPGAEYLIWFVFKDEKPVDALLTVSFLPPGKSGSLKAASKSLGLPRMQKAEDTAGQPAK